MALSAYIVKRAIVIVITIFIVIVAVFTLLRLTPGDVALMLAGEEATEEYLKVVRSSYGLDKPIYVQLLIYLEKVVRGDLGYSFAFAKPVTGVILERAQATFILVGGSLITSIFVGTWLGIFAARKSHLKISKVILWFTSVIYSAPTVWFGLIIALVFAYQLRLFPLSGMVDVRTPVGGLPYMLDILHHSVLPIITLSFFFLPPFVRVARASVLEVMGEDYVNTARAIGFDERTVFSRYVLKNAILPTITLAGLRLGLIFMGAVITESIYAWPGLGSLAVISIMHRDYPLIQGLFIFTTTFTLLSSLIVDIIYAFIDPRITLT